MPVKTMCSLKWQGKECYKKFDGGECPGTKENDGMGVCMSSCSSCSSLPAKKAVREAMRYKDY